MGNEDQTGHDAQEKRGDVDAHSRPRSRASLIDHVIAPLAVFASFYLAILFAAALMRAPLMQWMALGAVLIATVATVAIWDNGHWALGALAPPALVVRDLCLGSLFAFILIGLADLLIMSLTSLRHARGSGLPWVEIAALYVPAALHEEFLFRGYPFQRLWQFHRGVAIALMSLLFAAMHVWNTSVTPLALANIFLGGVILSLAYARHERLWFPIGIHFMWNLISGPILGYHVSGYEPGNSLLTVAGAGAPILTGGRFGIEGSAMMTVVEIGAISVLWWSRQRAISNGESLI